MTDTSTVVDHDLDEDREQPASHSRRRFNRAATIGAVLGGIVFVWMVTGGTFDLFRWQLLGNFYDEQAHSFLHGHLSIDHPGVLGIEAFLGRGGHSYMYQGPVPALLRLPIVAIAGHRLDGRLTEVSMIAALVVMLVFAARLHWSVRELVRGAAPVGRGEAWFVGLFMFVLAGGSFALYVASRAWVYHEAIMWGAALALAAVDRLVALVRRPTVGALAWCSGLTAATLLTRASVGLGPLLGLALVTAGLGAAILAARRGRRWAWLTWLAPGTEDGSHRPPFVGFGVAVVLPLAAYAGVNLAKFGTLFSIPFWGQRFTVVDPGRQAMLRANGGTLFGLQFVPTTIIHYLRPDGIAFTKSFPFVDFPALPGPVVGNVLFDLVDRSASLPAVAPLLLVLAAVGAAHAFWPTRWSESGRASLRVPVLAATAGAATILPFGFIANRYLGDFVPIVALAGAAGLQVLLTRPSTPSTHRWRVAGAAFLVLLAAWTCWANLGLALRYQREWSPNIDPPVLAGFLGFQDDVERQLGGDGLGPVERIGTSDPLPDGIGRAGALAMVGDCEALYLSDGMDVNSVKVSPWNAVERVQGPGHRRFRMVIPQREAGTIVPILTAGTPDEPYGVLLQYLGGDRVRLVYRNATGPPPRTEQPFDVNFGDEYDLDLVTDWRVDLLEARLGDATRLEARIGADTGRDVFDTFATSGRAGRNDVFDDVAARFPGQLREERVTTPLCDRLLARIDPGS